MSARRLPRWPFVIGGALLLGGLAFLTFETTVFVADQAELDRKSETTQGLLASWSSDAAAAAEEPPAEVPVTARPGTYEEFGVLYVPRWGRDYVSPILEGDSSTEVSSWVGVDHYPSTQMPGELGNFAVTGHNGRLGSGRFSYIEKLELGDKIYVETADGWYVYDFTHTDVIKPSQNDALAPVPYSVGTEPTKSIISLMACTYIGPEKHRSVAFGDFVEFVPRAEGAPADVAVLQ